MSVASTIGKRPEFGQLERHRRELTAYCYRMLGSPFEAEDAVQETLLRGWRALDRFEGRAQLRSWLYRIATNVCLDMLDGRKRRARPVDLGPAHSPEGPIGGQRSAIEWVEPIPDGLVTAPEDDPAELASARETLRLAFVAALQHLPPRQRAALILCEVLRWKASEAADLLDTSVASINSALQRARATLDAQQLDAAGTSPARLPAPDALDASARRLLADYVRAFEAYDMEALAQLIQQDAAQSMPPFELWLRGRDDILRWWRGPGAGCRGSRVLPARDANGCPAFAQYRRSESGDGHDAWALQVLHLDEDGRIGEFAFFLDVETVFPLFGLPLHID